MLGQQALELLLERVRQRIVRSHLVGKQGIAANVWQLLRMQERAQRRLGFVRQIRVPIRACIAQAGGLAVFDDVGDDQDLVMRVQLVVAQHMALQRAKTAAEGDVLGWRDALVAIHHHAVIQVQLVQAGKVVRRERLGQVQTPHFYAQAAAGTGRLGNRPHFEVLRARVTRHGRQHRIGHRAAERKRVGSQNIEQGRHGSAPWQWWFVNLAATVEARP